MIDYKFEHLNGGVLIKDATAEWISAGFNRKGDGLMTLEIEIKNDKCVYSVVLSKVGQTTTRSDEAIDFLMNELLKPYEVI